MWLDEYTTVSFDAVAFSRDVGSQRTVLYLVDGTIMLLARDDQGRRVADGQRISEMTLIAEIAPTDTGLTPYAWRCVRHQPGRQAECVYLYAITEDDIDLAGKPCRR